MRTLAILLILISACACSQHAHAFKEMTWECGQEDPRFKLSDPEAQMVRFRFVENSHYFTDISAKRLCDQLKHSGKKVVKIEFDFWRSSGSPGEIFANELSMDGAPIAFAGGGGSSGDDAGKVGPDPWKTAFEKPTKDKQ